MQPYKLYIFVFFFLFSLRQTPFAQTPIFSTVAHDQLHAFEDTLGVLSFAIQNDTSAAERFAACHQMIRVLKTALKTENSFHYPFSRLQSISIIAPPDSSFRIFTWQLFVNDSTYRYYGAIQMPGKSLSLYPLIDRSFEIPDPLSETLSPEKWYGALYYGLVPFGTKKQPKYLLLGFDGYSFFEKQKLIDVLSFDALGKPVFGGEVFDWPEDVQAAPDQQRIILNYSAEAKVRCNYDPMYEMVLFDHLITTGTSFGTVANVPDGSYDGLKLQKGRWKFINKVFNDVQEEAPTPAPLSDRKGKDIMGRKKKGE